MMKRRTRKQLPQILAAAMALMICMTGLGYVAVQSMGKAVADEFGCFENGPQSQIAVIVDPSMPRWTAEQGRGLRTALDRTYNSLKFNQRLSVYTTEGDVVSSVPKARFHICGQATSPEQLAAINAEEAQAGYLARMKQRLYEEMFAPELDALLTLHPDETRLQLEQSPMLEMFHAVSRQTGLKYGDKIIAASDLIQNSESARFCVERGDMPPFHEFSQRRIYQERLAPASFEGISIEVLFLVRQAYGPFCDGEGELFRFWRDYFISNGAAAPEFIRVR